METLPIFLRVGANGRPSSAAAPPRRDAPKRSGAPARSSTVFAARLDDEFRVLCDTAKFEHVARLPTRDDLASFVVCYVATGEERR